MNLTINLQISGGEDTGRLAALLEAISAVLHKGETVPIETPAPAAEIPVPAPAAEIPVPAPVAETPAPAEAPKPAARPWIPEMEEVRAAIEAARRRIEGSDYENAASAGRKKYHDALTREFRRIAETYGAPKPPLLAADHRASFIRDCEALILDASGAIIQQVPF